VFSTRFVKPFAGRFDSGFTIRAVSRHSQENGIAPLPLFQGAEGRERRVVQRNMASVARLGFAHSENLVREINLRPCKVVLFGKSEARIQSNVQPHNRLGRNGLPQFCFFLGPQEPSKLLFQQPSSMP
jgi:hypothetical protein